MQLVILESPYSGNVRLNERYARACVKDSLKRGEAPIASHLLYTQPGILDDEIQAERNLGISAGLAWMVVSHKTVVYEDLGISRGMQFGIFKAEQAGKLVEYRHLSLPELAHILRADALDLKALNDAMRDPSLPPHTPISEAFKETNS